MGKILLIDGNSVLNRAFYAIPLLTNREGLYTNAIYGFINILLKQIELENPDYVAVAFDVPKPTFRHYRFAAYKGNRKKMPIELSSQVPLLKDLLLSMSIEVFELEGFEADDILGTLARKSAAFGLEVIVVSGDKDLLQIATDTLKIRIPKSIKGKTIIEDYNAVDVLEKFGVSPTEYICVKALMGDSSDNIPGVPGIGEKTAVKIIREFKDIDTVIKNADVIKPKKASENITAFAEQLRLSYELATIDTNVPLEFALEDCSFVYPFPAVALSKFKQLEFNSIISKVKFDLFTRQQDDINPSGIECSFIKVSDTLSLNDLLSSILSKEKAAFVLHFNQLDFIGISLYYGENCCFYVEESIALSENFIVNSFKPFFEDVAVGKVTTQLKKCIHFLSKYDVSLNNVLMDISIAAYVLNPTQSSYSFDFLAKDYLNEELLSEEELLGKGKSRKSILKIDEPLRTQFLARQANVLFRLYSVFYDLLAANNQRELYYNVEQPLCFALAQMEEAGIKIDKSALVEFQSGLECEINLLTDDIYRLAGEQFNINSPKQLGEILFEKLNLRYGKRTKTGYSTSADVLERLIGEHDIVAKIMEYRTYVKLKSTYCDGLLNVMNINDNKIYSTFNQTVTATGRLSSTEPNLQNIPIRLELGRQLRKIFIPSSCDFVFIDGDYSQIELRVLAHMSGDESLIEAFNSGADIHRLTASKVNKIPYECVTPEQRSAAKAVNFGIVYGIGSFSLSQDLGIRRVDAEKYIDSYFEKYPNVKMYLDTLVAQAKKDGFVSTLFNRRRQIPELNSRNFGSRSFGERIAMNMPIQGTAADIIKIAMNNIHLKLIKLNLNAKIILQVHDELLIESHKDCAQVVKQLLKSEMEQAVSLKVPLVVDVHVGETWYDAK